MEIHSSSNKIKVTASFGITELFGTDSGIKIALDRADRLLYAAKNKGRNQVVFDAKINQYKELAIA